MLQLGVPAVHGAAPKASHHNETPALPRQRIGVARAAPKDVAGYGVGADGVLVDQEAPKTPPAEAPGVQRLDIVGAVAHGDCQVLLEGLLRVKPVDRARLVGVHEAAVHRETDHDGAGSPDRSSGALERRGRPGLVPAFRHEEVLLQTPAVAPAGAGRRTGGNARDASRAPPQTAYAVKEVRDTGPEVVAVAACRHSVCSGPTHRGQWTATVATRGPVRGVGIRGAGGEVPYADEGGRALKRAWRFDAQPPLQDLRDGRGPAVVALPGLRPHPAGKGIPARWPLR
mmetsp:Transcript_79191/g.235945  ORF Transcript_79191/g.235945 Transcript_79191/m.235945 type:complete len:285 (-) Transcript_79191:548-1402(-)